MPAPARQPRPGTSHFDVAEMAADMTPVAALRTPGFEWSGCSYPALGRSLSPHIDGLLQHCAVLAPLLVRSPTGFPAHADVVGMLRILQASHTILGDMAEHRLERQLREAADHWRIMAKHCYELRRRGFAGGGKDIQAMVSTIVLRAPVIPASADPLAGQADAVQGALNLF